MNNENQAPVIGPLPPELQTRLNLIIQNVPLFWDRRKYQHFTNHGPSHSERVHRLIAQLAQELPEKNRLTADETYIVSAASWLYETGMQKPILKPILDFELHGQAFGASQLKEIRDNKHLLSEKLIYESVSNDYKGEPINLGVHIVDDYTYRIAEICRYCSKEPLADIPEIDYAKGLPVRIRLLVALLRLADQLYIDPSRINLDLLERANLPEPQFARWWAYHYTQILPITNAQIRFHYFLPSNQKEFLGHIRALIEPEFEFENNPTIQFLWDAYQLRLMPPRRPSISRFDQAPGFQRPMSSDLLTFLRRNVKPIPTEIEAKSIEALEEPKERCLLVLDYENFILQLGQEGFFVNPEQTSRLVVSLLREASQEHDGVIDSLAVGHWGRPDLLEVEKMLKARVYTPTPFTANEDPTSVLTDIIEGQIEGKDKLKRIILVAPPIGLARMVKKWTDEGFLVSAWTSNVPDADIFHGGLGLRHKFLRYIFQLDEPSPVSAEDLEIGQAACILRLSSKQFWSISEIRTQLEQLEIVNDRVDWWILSLLYTDIFLVKDQNYQLNVSHPLVVQTHEIRKAIISALDRLDVDGQGIREDFLIKELRSKLPALNRNELMLRRFLTILKDEEILRRAVNLYGADSSSIWQLNTSHIYVVSAKADQFLPQFILALDHVLLKIGYYELKEHTLEKNLIPSLGENLVLPIYDAALEAGWIRRFETDEQLRNGNGKVALISLDEYHPNAGIHIKNRNLIVHFIRNRSGLNGMERASLWEQTKENRKTFAATRKEFDLYLEIMLRDGILLEEHNGQGSFFLKVDDDSIITQRLFGRMHLCNLVKNLRRLHATSAKNCTLLNDLESSMLQHGTPRNLLSWILEYAKIIRLVGTREQIINGQKQIGVWLQPNNYLQDMDEREKTICKELPVFIGCLSRDRQGWVPRPIVFAEMSKSTRYGSSRPEIEYWVSQLVWRGAIEQSRGDSQSGRDPYLLRAKPK